MGVSKVVYGNNTLIDLTGDTVTAADVRSGITAHGADGNAILGTMSTGTAWGDITGTLSNQTDLQSALDGKIDNPSSGSAGQILTKTSNGVEWADARTVIHYYLRANSWNGDTYVIDVFPYITTSSVVFLSPYNQLSASDYEMLANADIRVTGQSTGTVTLQALGDVPTSDIRIYVIVWG